MKEQLGAEEQHRGGRLTRPRSDGFRVSSKSPSASSCAERWTSGVRSGGESLSCGLLSSPRQLLTAEHQVPRLCTRR